MPTFMASCKKPVLKISLETAPALGKDHLRGRVNRESHPAFDKGADDEATGNVLKVSCLRAARGKRYG